MIARRGTETLEDLHKVEGKAELVNGRIIHYVASGDLPAEIAFEIAVRLRAYAKQTGIGKAYSDGLGYAIVPPLSSGRQSFQPDASYYTGAPPRDRMRFVEAAPDFAVEVRSEGDYGPAAEIAMAAKRADYFEAGTKVVWDVDPVAERIASYKADAPENPIAFTAGQVADAEPALPGWRLALNELFTPTE